MTGGGKKENPGGGLLQDVSNIVSTGLSSGAEYMKSFTGGTVSNIRGWHATTMNTLTGYMPTTTSNIRNGQATIMGSTSYGHESSDPVASGDIRNPMATATGPTINKKEALAPKYIIGDIHAKKEKKSFQWFKKKDTYND